MADGFQVGMDVCTGFKVLEIKNRTVASRLDNPIIEFREIRLDCAYENAAFILVATFQSVVPPVDEWIQIALTGREQIDSQWTPLRMKAPFVALAYRKLEHGRITAVTNLITRKGKSLVSAQLLWFGFPLINTLYVGFKPGMRERTEELLTASLTLL
jgi:hypothetical protein